VAFDAAVFVTLPEAANNVIENQAHDGRDSQR
jgi:hypothetical protein